MPCGLGAWAPQPWAAAPCVAALPAAAVEQNCRLSHLILQPFPLPPCYLPVRTGLHATAQVADPAKVVIQKVRMDDGFYCPAFGLPLGCCRCAAASTGRLIGRACQHLRACSILCLWSDKALTLDPAQDSTPVDQRCGHGTSGRTGRRELGPAPDRGTVEFH